MKKLLQSLLILGAFSQAALFAQAQTAPKILFVDMAKLYDGHYRAIAETAKLKSDAQKAQAQLDSMNKDVNAQVEQYKELADQSNNPTATTEAKAKAQAAAQQKRQEIGQSEAEIQKFQENVGRQLQQRGQEIRSMYMEEIAKTAADVAKRDGATILLDKAGPSFLGVPVVLYSDPALDITTEVAIEIAKSRPVETPATPAATPADAAAPAPAKN
jgi:outer membrane protein